MQVPFVHGPGDLRLSEVAAPQPGPSDVVLRVAYAGICGSDLGYVAVGGVGGPVAAPVPLGHELSGTVLQVGAAVRSVAVGDRVVLNPLVNLVGNGGPECGFAEQLLVRDVAGKPGSLLALPPQISLEMGALVEPLAVAAHAVSRLGVEPASRVAIFGAGPIGLGCVVMLRQRGVRDIVVIDPSAFRRDTAARLGARGTLDPRQQSVAIALSAMHGTVPLFRGEAPATTHFVEASGAPVLPEIVDFCRSRATICVVSVQKYPAPIDMKKLMTKELILTGALGYPSEFVDIIALLSDGAINPAAMISHRFASADFMAAFAAAGQPDQAAKVLVRY